MNYREVSVGLSGDTKFSYNLVEACKVVDVLIHNAWVAPKGSSALELVASPEETGMVFNLVNPKLAVVSHYNVEDVLLERVRSFLKDLY